MDWLGLLLLLGAGLLVAWAIIVGWTILSLTRPLRRTFAWALSRSLPTLPSEVRSGTHDHLFQYSAAAIRGHPCWKIKGDDAYGPVVVFTHGWGESRWVALRRLRALAANASSVVLWDLPGHGDASGTFSLGIREHHILLELIEHLDLGPDSRIVLAGSSLGAGVSIAAAADRRAPTGAIIGIIAEAPYRLPWTPARNVMESAGIPTWATLIPSLLLIGLRFGMGVTWRGSGDAGGFDRAGVAAKLKVPLVVIHGDADAVCPIDDGRAIAGSAPNGAMVAISGADHSNLCDRREYGDAIRDFMVQLAADTLTSPRSITAQPAHQGRT